MEIDNKEIDKLFSSENVIFDCQAKNKEEAFALIAKKAVSLKVIKKKDEQKLVAGFLHRESETSTGLEDGFAIPHARIKEITKPMIIFVRFTEELEWKTFDDSKVKVAIALMIPESKSSDVHLKILTTVAQKLLDQNVREILKNSQDKNEIINSLFTKQAAETNKNYKGYIIAITSCPAGVAHTYMAAQKIQDYAQKQGYLVKVEKQGANGFEDKLTENDVKQANVLIIAADVNVSEQERFTDIPVAKFSVTDPLHNVENVFNKALEQKRVVKNQDFDSLTKSKSKEKGPKDKNWFKLKFKAKAKNLKDAVLTGISYVVPVIVAGTAIQAFITIIGQIAGADWITVHANWLNTLNNVSGKTLSVLLAPILSAYIAYALADKPGLTPGFLGGLACNYVTKTTSQGIVIVDGLGFLGGLIIGIIAGYLMMGFKKYIVNKKVQGVLTWFVYPVFGSLIIMALVLFGIGQPIALLINVIFTGLTNLQNSHFAALLGVIIGMMCVFDLGGPFNKVAWAFSTASIAQAGSTGNLSLLVPYSCFWAAGIGTGWTTTLVTTIGKKWCNEYEQDAGKISWLLSSLGITEGAIPFALSDPFRVIPSFLLAGGISGGLTAAFNLGSPIMGGGFITMAGMKSAIGAYSIGVAILMWLIFAIIGCAVSTALILFLKYLKSNSVLEKKVKKWTLTIVTFGLINVIKKNKENKLAIKENK